MNHLVLGSEGQIGWHLKNILREEGQKVYEFDIKRSKHEDLRIKNNRILLKKIEKSDFVHFLAFDIGGAKYMKGYQDSKEFIDNNTKIMVNTFDVVNQFNKPFIFASSQMSNMSYSTYGQLKSIGEKITKDIGGMIVKFWNVYGYERDEEKSHVITDFIRKAKENGEIEMITDGTEERQFLYGDDAAKCLYELSKRYSEIGSNEKLHITSFEWTKIKELAKIISNKFGNGEVVPGERNSYDVQKDKKNEPSKDVLEYWTPETNLSKGIDRVHNIMYNK